MDLVLTIGMFELLRRQHGANIAMATINNAPCLAVGFTAKNGTLGMDKSRRMNTYMIVNRKNSDKFPCASRGSCSTWKFNSSRVFHSHGTHHISPVFWGTNQIGTEGGLFMGRLETRCSHFAKAPFFKMIAQKKHYIFRIGRTSALILHTLDTSVCNIEKRVCVCIVLVHYGPFPQVISESVKLALWAVSLISHCLW